MTPVFWGIVPVRQTEVWFSSGCLFLFGIVFLAVSFVFSLAHRLGIGESGEVRRIRVGLHRLRDSFRSPAVRQQLADERKRSDDAAFHDRLMAHQRSQRGEID